MKARIEIVSHLADLRARVTRTAQYAARIYGWLTPTEAMGLQEVLQEVIDGEQTLFYALSEVIDELEEE